MNLLSIISLILWLIIWKITTTKGWEKNFKFNKLNSRYSMEYNRFNVAICFVLVCLIFQSPRLSSMAHYRGSKLITTCPAGFGGVNVFL